MIWAACECSSLEFIDYIYVKLEVYRDSHLAHSGHLAMSNRQRMALIWLNQMQTRFEKKKTTLTCTSILHESKYRGYLGRT